MTIKSYEDLRIWQDSVQSAVEIYQLTNGGSFSRDFSLRDQIRRAIVSVSSNIVEGFERGGKKEFIRYLFIAKGSACEVRSQLYIAKQLSYISDEQYEHLSSRLHHVTNSIGRFISYLRNSANTQHVNTQTRQQPI